MEGFEHSCADFRTLSFYMSINNSISKKFVQPAKPAIRFNVTLKIHD